MVRICQFCGQELEDVLLSVGGHLLECEKAPFKDMDDEIVRRNAVQLYILQTLLKRK